MILPRDLWNEVVPYCSMKTKHRLCLVTSTLRSIVLQNRYWYGTLRSQISKFESVSDVIIESLSDDELLDTEPPSERGTLRFLSLLMWRLMKAKEKGPKLFVVDNRVYFSCDSTHHGIFGILCSMAASLAALPSSNEFLLHSVCLINECLTFWKTFPRITQVPAEGPQEQVQIDMQLCYLAWIPTLRDAILLFQKVLCALRHLDTERSNYYLQKAYLFPTVGNRDEIGNHVGITLLPRNLPRNVPRNYPFTLPLLPSEIPSYLDIFRCLQYTDLLCHNPVCTQKGLLLLMAGHTTQQNLLQTYLSSTQATGEDMSSWRAYALRVLSVTQDEECIRILREVLPIDIYVTLPIDVLDQ